MVFTAVKWSLWSLWNNSYGFVYINTISQYGSVTNTENQHKHTHTYWSFLILRNSFPSPVPVIFQASVLRPAVTCFEPVYPGNRRRICLRELCQTQARFFPIIVSVLLFISAGFEPAVAAAAFTDFFLVYSIRVFVYCIYLYTDWIQFHSIFPTFLIRLVVGFELKDCGLGLSLSS